ncbi:GYD domain-containing protein [Bradyrhizobium algeriense]|uniref:GYD domain-containing protein n=1 Tax=Bradyrhizobium algeriense TaxID=634784 RepID=UPI000D34BBDB|nr:GYD domain-containing protein [Bradyrhizobium algeriense]
MKYVLLGNLSPEWASKQSERTSKAKAKLDKLGIKIESIHYMQGYYDFVDIVDAPNEAAMLAFSVWYATQGLGRIQRYAGFRRKDLRDRDQGRSGLSTRWLRRPATHSKAPSASHSSVSSGGPKAILGCDNTCPLMRDVHSWAAMARQARLMSKRGHQRQPRPSRR